MLLLSLSISSLRILFLLLVLAGHTLLFGFASVWGPHPVVTQALLLALVSGITPFGIRGPFVVPGMESGYCLQANALIPVLCSDPSTSSPSIMIFTIWVTLPNHPLSSFFGVIWGIWTFLFNKVLQVLFVLACSLVQQSNVACSPLARLSRSSSSPISPETWCFSGIISI